MKFIKKCKGATQVQRKYTKETPNHKENSKRTFYNWTIVLLIKRKKIKIEVPSTKRNARAFTLVLLPFFSILHFLESTIGFVGPTPSLR
jgi:hypothetical protein